jgi:hypothetical protein
MGAEPGVLSFRDHETASSVEVLEHTAQRLREAALRADLEPAKAKRWSRLAEDLGSHALAARVLVTSGASNDSLRSVLERATSIIDEELRHGSGPAR